jgi:hypothetical protein
MRATSLSAGNASPAGSNFSAAPANLVGICAGQASRWAKVRYDAAVPTRKEILVWTEICIAKDGAYKLLLFL